MRGIGFTFPRLPAARALIAGAAFLAGAAASQAHAQPAGEGNGEDTAMALPRISPFGDNRSERSLARAARPKRSGAGQAHPRPSSPGRPRRRRPASRKSERSDAARSHPRKPLPGPSLRRQARAARGVADPVCRRTGRARDLRAARPNPAQGQHPAHRPGADGARRGRRQPCDARGSRSAQQPGQARPGVRSRRARPCGGGRRRLGSAADRREAQPRTRVCLAAPCRGRATALSAEPR